MFRAAIHTDGARVYGVRLQTSTGALTDIGSDKGTATLELFDVNKQLIGFYGSGNEAGITQLGYLTHDPSCVPVFPNLEKTEEEKAKEAEEE